MTITKSGSGSTLTLALEGRLDTSTAPQLEAELNASLNGVKDLTLDMADLAYLSSAGLRVVLAAQKRMNRQGHTTVTHVCDDIMEVFEITGFVDILDIKG